MSEHENDSSSKQTGCFTRFRRHWKDYLSDRDILDIQDRSMTLASSSIIIVDALAPHLPLVYCNKAFTTLTGYTSEEVLGRNCKFLQGADTDPETSNHLRKNLRGGKGCGTTIKNYRKDGTPFWNELMITPIHDKEGVLTHFIGVQHDVTARKATEEDLLAANKKLESLVCELAAANKDLDDANAQLHHSSLHDSLTGAANRSLFDDRISQAIARRKRYDNYHFSVLYIDLDGFKSINDGYGHRVGDRLLVSVVARLRESVRPSDTIARLGGDEFAVILEDLGAFGEAEMIAERVRDGLVEAHEIDEHSVHISASIGIVTEVARYSSGTELLHDADTAMYKAKTSGKNQNVAFEASMRPVIPRLQRELRTAIEQEGLEVHYQPILAGNDARLVGFEALVRWRHPKLGYIRPDDFIPLAEKTGMIIALDRYVLVESCKQTVRWQKNAASSLGLNVNFSGYQLFRSDLVPFVVNVLTETGLEASNLRLELTESIMMNATSMVQENLTRLGALGIELYIDDFGTGFSSLSYLQSLPAKVIKIDRSFLIDAHCKKGSRELLSSIVMLAHNLGLGVVAEGIELEPQLELTRKLECEYVQGFYFSPPMSVLEASSYIDKAYAASANA